MPTNPFGDAPVNSPSSANPFGDAPVNSPSSANPFGDVPTSNPSGDTPLPPLSDADFQQKYQERNWGDMLAGKTTTTPADVAEMTASGRIRPDQIQRMQTESDLRQKYADENAKYAAPSWLGAMGQMGADFAKGAANGIGELAQDATVVPRLWQTYQDISANPGGMGHDLGRLGNSVLQGGYDAATGLGKMAAGPFLGAYHSLKKDFSGPQSAADAEADYQKWKADYISKNAVPGYAPPAPSVVQNAESAITGVPAEQIPAPIPAATSLVSTGATMGGFGAASKLAEKAIPAIADATGLSKVAPNLVASATPGATGQAMKIQNAMNSAVKGAVPPPALPTVPAVKPVLQYVGEQNGKPVVKLVKPGTPEIPGKPPLITIPGQAPGVVPEPVGAAATTANAAGQAISKAGAGMTAVGEKVAPVTKWAKPAGGVAATVGTLTGNPALTTGGLGVTAMADRLEALGKQGAKTAQVGDLISRVATATPDSPFGRLATVLADPTAPDWMKEILNSKSGRTAQTTFNAIQAIKGAAAGTLKGAAAGTALGVASGNSPEETGQNAATMGLFGGVTGGMGAKDAKIFESHVGNVSDFVTKAIQTGTAPETLRQVPADAVLNAAIWSKAFPQVTTRFATPTEPGSPFAPGGAAAGKAGLWDSANKTVWVDPSANRAPMNTLLHEWFHPVFDQMVAQRPEIKAQLDSALARDGKTIEDFRQDYGAKAGFSPEQMQTFSPDNAYSELLSEAAQHHLYDADLVNAAQGKFTQATATQEALRTLQGWMSDTGTQQALASKQRAIAAGGPEGELFPQFRGTLDQPELRDLSTRLLKGQRDMMMGGETQTKGIPVDNDYASSMRFYNVGGRQISPYMEKIPSKNGTRVVQTPARVLLKRAKTEMAAYKKYFAVGTPVTKVPPAFYADPDIMPWTKESAKAAEDAIAQGKGLEFWHHYLAGGKLPAATQTGRMTPGNTEARLMRMIPESLSYHGTGNLNINGADELALHSKIAQWAGKHGDASLDLWGGDPAKVQPDLEQYFKNHTAGLPGETGIGTQKRDVLNALVGGANKEFEASNPLRSGLIGKDKKAVWRASVTRLMEAPQPFTPDWIPNWEKAKRNLSPDIPAGPLPGDAEEYAKVQKQMGALDFSDPEFESKLMAVFAKMEEIKNRNQGYAPGTQPK